ncbi:DNA-processing protein DprA [Aerobium aerolatum]|uniref:DNA processing protein n=1 Tax=Aquamicrobium aerolatum DSM 21857 TaxID=1121003 RepID=A0A1I3K932_9HYPH|nr:DNA-processing protein DprA [Aquamicrobium aerolatum]SFI68904.1 DNA processing protein [Aquamicrobium aerolatum DSM 21857]
MSGAPSASLRLTDRQRLNWLRLIRSENVGPVSFRTLINRYGSAEAALDALPELALRGGAARRIRIASQADAEAEILSAQRHGANFVAIGESDYPPMLRMMDAPPPLLAVKGNAATFTLPSVAIVGARNASIAGMQFTRIIANTLGHEGFAVVSGLARGIDATAHQASLDTGTIAVLAGGLDRPYPPENIALCGQIAERGALISEMPFGWEPRAKDFPRRNRLVAGLALGLVVVEAAKRSGSLISARLANEMGRLVFAVPGSPLDPRAAGANQLLKDGALMVTEAADILDALTPLAAQTRGERDILLAEDCPGDEGIVVPSAQSDTERLIEALGPTPIQLDDVIRHTGLHPSQVFSILLELDLAGRLERHVGGSVSLVPNA